MNTSSIKWKAREKEIDGCYECKELVECTKGFYQLDNDGANACKAQAMFICRKTTSRKRKRRRNSMCTGFIRNMSDKKLVALIFDDGPTVGITGTSLIV